MAGFRAWLELGYRVRKGEKAIWILAPMAVKQRAGADGDDEEKRRVFFRAVPVFDTQVAPVEGGKQSPLDAPCEPLCGDSHVHLLELVAELARSLGYTVSFERTPEARGLVRSQDKTHSDRRESARQRTAAHPHETAHALGIDYKRYPREQAEVIVDTVTFIVCSSVGLAVDGETLPYIAGWGENGALEAVSEFAHTIDALARRIEGALSRSAESAGHRC